MRAFLLAGITAALTGSALAAPIDIPLDFTIAPGGTGPSGEDVSGQVSRAVLSFDDSLATPGAAFSVSGSDLALSLTFLGRAVGPGEGGFDENLQFAAFGSDGALQAIDFFVDIGNDFFFSGGGDLTFSYDFSFLDGNGEQQTIGGGSGQIAAAGNEPPPLPPVPLPAGAVLLLTGIVGLAGLRRRA